MNINVNITVLGSLILPEGIPEDKISKIIDDLAKEMNLNLPIGMEVNDVEWEATK